MVNIIGIGFWETNNHDLHSQYSVSFDEASLFSSSTIQNRTDMLQRSVQLSIDWPQGATFIDLSSDIETKSYTKGSKVTD